MGDSGFGLKFRAAERPGIYFRVLNEGEVEPGERVELVPADETIVSIVDLFRLAFEPQPDPEPLQHYLDAPLSERMRKRIEGKLSDSRQ